MTREEILAMKPGIDMDVLVAEKVMGWKDVWKPFFPSTDISAAWEVMEVFGWVFIKKYISVGNEIRFQAYIEDNDYQRVSPDSTAICDTAPEAICKAALLAVMEGKP